MRRSPRYYEKERAREEKAAEGVPKRSELPRAGLVLRLRECPDAPV